jgi:hypothetical protein
LAPAKRETSKTAIDRRDEYVLLLPARQLKSEEMSNEIFERRVITPGEREAQKVFREVEAAKAMTEVREGAESFL